ncbi:MAG: Ig-like domain-containing protein [Mogibacterium sp.]|nr:Ig-like domain-containing protein [Mogibacterium sp.]MBQ6501518.1 Ig-like domain-containing protein [Mogibacterium sp.]
MWRTNRTRILIIITSALLLVGAQFAYAKDSTGMTVFNTNLITTDVDATYIEGKVDNAVGQTISVKIGPRSVAEKTMPNTGGEASFRIKIPGKFISKNIMTVYTVKEKDPETGKTLDRERVEVNFVDREQQEITLDKEDYDLTFPGNDREISAEASSGDDLIYSSSNPDVATVDEDGKITTTGEGDATITVKQIGNGQYDEAEASFNVSVEEIDAYTVTYHSSADKDETVKQVIPNGSTESLQENGFEYDEREFLGWAASDDGLVEYTDAQSVSDLGEPGDNIDLYAVWTGDGIRAAVAWAVKIANDDSFTYGKKPQTSNLGCYFCGTNQKRKPKGYEKTYVCLTFVHAAYAHGAGDPVMLRECQNASHVLSVNNDNFSHYSCWQKVGLTKNLTIDDLQPGDVICWYSSSGYSNGHMAMYIGNNQICDAEGIKDCWGPASIAVRGNAAGQLRSATRHSSKSYVMRYVG